MVRSLAPDRLEKALGGGAILLLAAILAALARGRDQWAALPGVVWAHLATIIVALALTPVLLWNVRGTRMHRVLGWTWALAMFATAVISFWVRSSDGRLSVIHVLSALTVLLVPLLVLAARRHRVSTHRRAARAFVIGALLTAGFFTFPFGRLLGRWLLG